MAHLNAIQDPLLKPCLLEQVKANPDVVAALQQKGFASAETAQTGRTARVNGKSIRKGDVALFPDGGDTTFVGEIYWFAKVGSEVVVGCSTWPLKKEYGRCRKVKVEENNSIVCLSQVYQAMIFTPTTVGKIATVIMPVL